uniref:Uncharacterized protein n=1 Tax=Dromaius novaehollandiae TaxID=8790 RepID=A0A8C4JJ20_DRONO
FWIHREGNPRPWRRTPCLTGGDGTGLIAALRKARRQEQLVSKRLLREDPVAEGGKVSLHRQGACMGSPAYQLRDSEPCAFLQLNLSHA